MSLTVGESVAVGVVLRALNQMTTYDPTPPDEVELRNALDTLAESASKRMQMTYLPTGARKPLKLRVRH